MEKLKKLYQTELHRFAQQKKKIRRLWNISEKTAELLYFFVLFKTPDKILEIGTSNGYSTFWLSLAAEKIKAKIISIEIDDTRFALAKENLQQRKNVELLKGNALELIPTLKSEFELIFIDAGKIDYIKYLQLLFPKMKDNSLIIADNVISHKNTVKEYLDFIKSDPGFLTMTLPFAAGLEISIFKREK